jgi:PPOX class probable F420-dependent enzyme
MLEPSIKKLAQGRNFGTICVHLANGQIASHVMWVDADDDHMLINTEVHRAKFKAVEANPSVTVTVWSAENPYSYGEVRGTVAETVRGPEARAHIDALAEKYTNKPYGNPIQSERVILKIRPDRQRTMGL